MEFSHHNEYGVEVKKYLKLDWLMGDHGTVENVHKVKGSITKHCVAEITDLAGREFRACHLSMSLPLFAVGVENACAHDLF